ncbi:MAG: ABC transporter permease [Chitinispirillaceae bacterium]|nr:ABC transporter permease [Chitinispirillaceae bacterium]
MKTNKNPLQKFLEHEDKRWLLIWLISLLLIGVWDFFFLNQPAFFSIVDGFISTLFVASCAVIFTFFLAWISTLLFYYFENNNKKINLFLLSFLVNLIRSIPQIIGVLFGYVAITIFITQGILTSKIIIFILMSFYMSFFIMPEVIDLLRERIDYFSKLDFFNALRVCGVSDWRIINFDILWKNSRLHIVNKMISIFGSAIFLQCSVDFIISVGLSQDVNTVTLPVTLGSLLAKMDSKQDILAIGNTLTNITYFPNLLFQHLQGITVAFLIVITLLSIYRISCGYAERHHL